MTLPDGPELLHEAAARLRDPYLCNTQPYTLPLADWLDAEAAIWDKLLTLKAEVTPRGYKLTWPESTQNEAVAVARSIVNLGSEASPS